MSCEANINRRLKFLKAPDLLKPLTSIEDYRELVTFLENRIIRNYQIQDRKDLINPEGPTGKWKNTFKIYLTDLKADSQVLESLNTKDWQKPCLQFLLDLSVEYEYQDKKSAGDFEKLNVNGKDSTDSKYCWSSPEFDPKSEAFLSNLRQMAKFLGIRKQILEMADGETLLKTIVTVLENAPDNRKLVESSNEHGVAAFKLKSLNEVASGIDTGDNKTNDVARILRLLHINNCRSFQNLINRLIVKVQEYTANPIVDQKLSKIGRS